MITGIHKIRTRYSEVDQMGYVYHANYVDYCHQARTELLRKLQLNDKVLEDNNLMLPVIDFEINYKNPAHYDEQLTISTTITDLPKVRFHFDFSIYNQKNLCISKAASTVVFVNKQTRRPVCAPNFVRDKLKNYANLQCV